MAYDFWETMKKFLEGELKVETGTNSITVKPTLNPLEAISNIQKAASLKNQTKPQQTAETRTNGINKTAQVKAGGKTGGYAAPQNPVLNNIAKMISNVQKQDANNSKNSLGKTGVFVTATNPVVKNVANMISNASQNSIQNQNALNGDGVPNNLISTASRLYGNNIPKSQNMSYNNTNTNKNSKIVSLSDSPANVSAPDSSQKNLSGNKENISTDSTSNINNPNVKQMPVNTGKIENDIWRQAAYKGYFDGTWYEDEEKVLKCAEILLDEVKQNGGLNLEELQKDKVKRELFEELVINEPGKDDNLVNDLGDLEAIANFNDLGEINPFNITPEQLEALIEHYKGLQKHTKGEKIAIKLGNIVLEILQNAL